MDDTHPKALLAQYGLTPNRALGQNFLADPRAVTAILDLAGVDGKPVLEIGPGLGALTGELLARAARVAAVELDAAMAAVLRDRFGPALLLMREDFLKTDLAALRRELGPFHVVGNLPYYVTTPICTRLLCADPIPSMTLMVQQEAAERFFAKPGERVYGPLTVLAQCYYDAAPVLRLAPASFYPRPEVDSCVVRLTDRGLVREEALPGLLRAAFAMRRKTLVNNLKAYPSAIPAGEALSMCGLPPGVRAEAVEPARFIRLARLLAGRP